ncbi:diacylglycerol kinase [Streptococcus cuniculi]|uniref:Diacylglycerol kinase n=1 Tax=Streptococcus cuniculi TaxID=1432788 RepID=A0A1Q8EAK7_9STRE|nr:diacylglycerol kinase family lipid kinase [Streptococcus cuniculi]OLF48824.1 diacylglycerol kinase [Streptococcus cuniculi]
MEQRKRARLIYNPVSGQEIMKKNVAEVLHILEGFGYETSAFQTSPEKDSAKNEATRAAQAGFDLIIAAGGDGTINEVVNGLSFPPKRPQMAIIPTGTTNDYARALKIPRGNPIEAAKVIGKGQTILMDIGLAKNESVGENYFINIAAAGTLTELTYSVPSQLKTIFGYLAYVVKGAELLPRVQFTPVRVSHDEGVFEGKISMIFVALTNSIGGFEQIVPDAKLDDGMFTLIMVKTGNLFEILHLIRLVIDGGKHVDSDKIEYIKTRQLTVESLDSSNRMMLNLDGEYGGDAPVELINLANHIEFFADTDKVADEAITLDTDDMSREDMAKRFIEEADHLEGTI